MQRSWRVGWCSVAGGTVTMRWRRKLYWYLALERRFVSSRPGRLMGGWQWGSSGDGDALAGVESNRLPM
jgi:hypothetical protein